MRRPPMARAVTLLLAAIGAAVALVILRQRNLYEDEWLSLAFIQKPMGELWRWTIECGCHPPGALALDRLALLGLGTARGIAAVHLAVWFACMVFFVLRAGRLLRSDWGRAGFAAAALMHPQLLMWAGTIRWYGVWWGVALVVLAVGLLPGRSDRAPSWAVTGALGLAGALLLYLDYLAFIFLPCFGVAWLVRYGPSRASAARVLAITAISSAVAWPVVTTFPGQQALAQCSAEVANQVAATFQMLHGLSIGQAIMPWHPVGVIVLVGLLLPSLWGLVRGLIGRLREPAPAHPAARRELAALVIFLALMLAAAIASGLGTKPRSFLGLTALVSLQLAIGAEHLRARPWRALAAALAVLWIATGAYHLIARTGTAKRQLNDRPEQVIARLEQIADGGPALVLTSNLILTFEINQRRAQGRTPLVMGSIWNDPVHGFPAGLPADAMRLPWVIVLAEAEVGSTAPDPGRVALSAARRMIADERREDVGWDPDWQRKSRLAGQQLEPYRFRLWYGRPRPGDWRPVDARLQAAARGTILGENF
ncbi:MAG: hypothetical protein ACRENJ_05345 [Candidatus Eiseniibacteriota bacterium]